MFNNTGKASELEETRPQTCPKDAKIGWLSEALGKCECCGYWTWTLHYRLRGEMAGTLTNLTMDSANEELRTEVENLLTLVKLGLDAAEAGECPIPTCKACKKKFASIELMKARLRQTTLET